jgi:exosortase A-associated hydrolase 1
MREIAFRFDCRAASLLGILHLPSTPAPLGVLMFVGGGPQYRAGGHRQLVLWARELADRGLPVMRFDYRGVGDSGGEFRGFDAMEADTTAAVREFFARVPELRELVLWGECDASSAIMMHAHKDQRIVGISLQNPWARTTSGQAKAYIKYYYLRRLTEPSFWQKVRKLRFNPFVAMWSLLQNAYRAWREPALTPTTEEGSSGSYIDRMKTGFAAFRGKVLLYMSGRDLIAREFDELVAGDPGWRAICERASVRRIDLPMADHTFSSAEMRKAVLDPANEWLGALLSERTQTR